MKSLQIAGWKLDQTNWPKRGVGSRKACCNAGNAVGPGGVWRLSSFDSILIDRPVALARSATVIPDRRRNCALASDRCFRSHDRELVPATCKVTNISGEMVPLTAIASPCILTSAPLIRRAGFSGPGGFP